MSIIRRFVYSACLIGIISTTATPGRLRETRNNPPSPRPGPAAAIHPRPGGGVSMKIVVEEDSFEKDSADDLKNETEEIRKDRSAKDLLYWPAEVGEPGK